MTCFHSDPRSSAFIRRLSLPRWTLLVVFRSVLRQQPAQVRIVAGGWIAEPAKLVNRPVHLSKTEMLLQLHDQRYLVTLPPTRQSPARIRIDKHSPPGIDMLLNDREQLVTRPSTARPDCLPTSFTNRRPVMHRNRLRTGDHHRVQRHLL